MPRAAFITLGCKVNQYETQKILESFETAGFEVVPFDSPADVYVVNTCSVTSIAEGKSRYAVRRASRLSPGARIAVTGCAAQMSLNRNEAFPDADVVVPNPEKLETLRYVLDAFPDLRPVATPIPMSSAPAGRTRATLKVQDGCDVFCSYCSIPFTRPGLRSRPVDEVVVEAKRLAEAGYLEAILTGVLIGAYGPETGSGGPDFPALVRRLARESGLPRLRISSIEMHQVTPEIIDMARFGEIVPHFHIPLQSGDSQVLRDMNRRYDRDQFLALCDHLHATVPGVTLTTDLLVGFPTETEAAFENSLDAVRRARFIKTHSFRFSPRFGTPADAWGDPVSPVEKQRRAAELGRVSAEVAQAEIGRWQGRVERVLLEGKVSTDGLLSGLTDQWITVKCSGSPSLARSLQWVRLDEQQGDTFFGEIVSAPDDLRQVASA